MPKREMKQLNQQKNGFHTIRVETSENGMAILSLLLIGKIMAKNFLSMRHHCMLAQLERLKAYLNTLSPA